MSTFTNKASTALTISPAAEPYYKDRHGNVNAGYGANNAGLTKGALHTEVFDLLRPSYGDTWPMFQAPLVTYEQGGSGIVLRAIETSVGDTLTLYRIQTTRERLSTIEAAGTMPIACSEFCFHRRSLKILGRPSVIHPSQTMQPE